MEIYLHQDGERTGPHTLENVQGWLEGGQITVSSAAWFEGCSDWVTVQDLPGIMLPGGDHLVDVATVPPFDAYKGDEPYVFVSYSHKDAAVVYDEITRLHEAGCNVWYDEGIDASNEWPEEIANAVIGCAAFLVFISPRATASVNCRNEINLALNEKKSFLAIYLEETGLPPGLRLRMGDLQAILRYKLPVDRYQRKAQGALDQLLGNKPAKSRTRPPIAQQTEATHATEPAEQAVQTDTVAPAKPRRKGHAVALASVLLIACGALGYLFLGDDGEEESKPIDATWSNAFTSLVLWLDASDVDGDGKPDAPTEPYKFANWVDKAGMDHNARPTEEAHQPEVRFGLRAEKPNLGLVHLDGNESLSFPPIDKVRTLICVVERGENCQTHTAFIGHSATDKTWGYHGNHRIRQYGSKSIYEGLQRRDGEEIKFNQGGSFLKQLQITVLVTTKNVTADLLGLRRVNSGNRFFIGNYAEIMIYDRPLDESEILAVEKYLGDKWGIALKHDGSNRAGDFPGTGKIIPVVAKEQSFRQADVNTQTATTFTPGQPWTVPTGSLEMLWCEPGTFMMGSLESEEGRKDDETRHQVTLTKGFYLGKYEVTQVQYQAIMTGNTDGLNPTPSRYPGNDRPVEKVSWDDAQIFLTRLNAAEQAAGRLPLGWSYVLPTESEWEYACRAGTTTAYSWGNTIATTNANYSSSGINQTRDFGLYAANAWGFYDMHGNVDEWVFDWKANYPERGQTDPEGPPSGSYRVLRSGSFFYGGAGLRSAARHLGLPGGSHSARGFRVGFKAGQ